MSFAPTDEAGNGPDQHLPLGIASWEDGDPLPVCRSVLGIIRLDAIHERGLLGGLGIDPEVWHSPTLDPILAAGPDAWGALHDRLVDVVADPAATTRLTEATIDPASVRMELPFTVADYVDFYSSRHHATNVGRIFRPHGEPLLPNWNHIPVGYHGRSASIGVSGTEVARPMGVSVVDGSPKFGASTALDYELEVGFVVGVGNESLPLSTADFSDHVFGVCLVNDWSARDIQSFEYQPLGPFLAKSFHTSISPWITQIAAVAPYRCDPPPPEVEIAPYLRSSEPWGLAIELEIHIESVLMRESHIDPMLVSTTSFADMAWTPDQQLAHLSVNGSTLRTGDFYASGTVSGPHSGQEGSLLERTLGATMPLALPDGSERTYLLDGDRVVMRGRTLPHESGASGFELGEVTGTIVAPRHHPTGEA